MKLLLLLTFSVCAFAQSNDLFIMAGVDAVRPGNAIHGNYSIGYGRSLKSLRNWTPLVDEVTVSYTLEASAHTEAIGAMRNIDLPRTKRYGLYTSAQLGITSFTAGPVQNRLYRSLGVGLAIHFSRGSIWVQETANVIATVPWYTTTSIGWVSSW